MGGIHSSELLDLAMRLLSVSVANLDGYLEATKEPTTGKRGKQTFQAVQVSCTHLPISIAALGGILATARSLYVRLLALERP